MFEVLSEIGIDKHRLLNAIWDSVYSLYGDIGTSESKLWLIRYDKKGIGILRCTHTKVEEVRAALACVHSVNGAGIGISVIGVSGTIKGASRVLLKHALSASLYTSLSRFS